MKPWHTLHIEEVLQQLGVDPSKGLDPIEATRRLREFGSNELQASREVSPWAILLEQFQNILILILVVAIGRLAAYTFEGFALDRCHECDGIWLDRGEIEAIVRKIRGGPLGIWLERLTSRASRP